MQKNMADNNIVAEFADLEVLNAMVALLESEEKDSLVEAALTIANQFGADKSFADVLKSDAEEPCAKLISSFHNNLNLLVQKTWVEKADEALKEQVLFRLDNLCNALKEKKEASYEDFVVLLKDVVYLMFGSQAKTADFAEYALRIDYDEFFNQSVNELYPDMNDDSDDDLADLTIVDDDELEE